MIKRLRKGKKGSLQDLLFLIVILLTLGITIIIASLVANKVDESSLFSDDTTGTNQSKARAIYAKTIDSVVPKFDTIFVGTFIGGMLIIILLSFALKSPTAFFVLGFILTMVMVMLSGIISNVYDEVADNPALSSVSSQFTAMEFIMSHLPTVILVAATIISIVIYGLWRIGV